MNNQIGPIVKLVLSVASHVLDFFGGGGCRKHNSNPLGLIQSSLLSTKELLDWCHALSSKHSIRINLTSSVWGKIRVCLRAHCLFRFQSRYALNQRTLPSFVGKGEVSLYRWSHVDWMGFNSFLIKHWELIYSLGWILTRVICCRLFESADTNLLPVWPDV